MVQPSFCVQEWRETTQGTLGKRRFFVLLFLELWKWSILIIYYMFIGLYIIYSYIIYIYNMVFCFPSFSLMFYGINFLRPTSGCFLYLVSKGHSAGCARNDNSVSFHHAMFAHQCRNPEKYGINSFPLIYQKSIGTKTQLFKICFF